VRALTSNDGWDGGHGAGALGGHRPDVDVKSLLGSVGRPPSLRFVHLHRSSRGLATLRLRLPGFPRPN
jgi:hypothetical protein